MHPTDSGSAPAPAGRVWTDAVLLAVGTLTVVRVPAPRAVDLRRAGRAMVIAPAAALVPGLGAAVSAAAGRACGLGWTVCAVLALGASAWLTRGLHLDGLADTADGLAASYDRRRALDVMRRGDSGPAGICVLVLVLLLQAALVSEAMAEHGVLAAAVGIVVGRLALPLACHRRVPAARPEGLGAAVASSVGPVALAGSALLTVAALAGLWAAAGHVGGVADASGPAASLGLAAVAAAAGLLAAAGLVLRAVRRLGGITGDVLGACVEVASTAAWVALAVLA